jgi:hypothetical protein
MRTKIFLVALLAVVGALGAAPRAAMGGFRAAPPPMEVEAFLTCPAHPPGFCCTGPPFCRCTRGSCI